MGRKKRPRQGQCVICGKHGLVTDDHVPPSCIFPDPESPNIPIVPTCPDCNGGNSKNDEYLRDVLAMSVDRKTPTVGPIVEKYDRSLFRPNASHAKRAHLLTLRKEAISTAGGIYLGDALVCDVDGERLNKEIERIVRGLFYYRERRVFPPDVSVLVYEGTAVILKQPRLIGTIRDISSRVMASNGPSEVISDVFAYKFNFLEGRSVMPYGTWWVIQFYESMVFFVWTDWEACRDLARSKVR